MQLIVKTPAAARSARRVPASPPIAAPGHRCHWQHDSPRAARARAARREPALTRAHPRNDEVAPRYAAPVSKTKRRVILALASVLTLASAAAVFWWWRFEPRCDPAPLEALGRELAEQPIEVSIMRRADVDTAVAAACPRVSFEYWRIARPGPHWFPHSRVNPKGVSREAAQALVWVLHKGWSDVVTPVVHTWTTIEQPVVGAERVPG